MKIKFDQNKQAYFSEEIPGLYFSSSCLSALKLETSINIILGNIEKYPKALLLVKHNLKEDEITVEFCKHTEMTAKAAWHIHERKIKISKDILFYPGDLLDSFIFEMANVGNKFFNSIDFNTIQSADEYALAIESAEHQTSRMACKILNEGRTSYGWPNPCFVFRGGSTLEEWLIASKKPSLEFHGYSHYSSYMTDYYSIKLEILQLKNETPQVLIQKAVLIKLQAELKEAAQRNYLKLMFEKNNIKERVHNLVWGLPQTDVVDEKTISGKEMDAKEYATQDQGILTWIFDCYRRCKRSVRSPALSIKGKAA